MGPGRIEGRQKRDARLCVVSVLCQRVKVEDTAGASHSLGWRLTKEKRPEGRFALMLCWDLMLRREQLRSCVHPLYGSVVSRTTMLNSGSSSEFSSVFSIKPNRVLTILTPIS